MTRQTNFKTDHRRAQVADEAARIIQEEGTKDFRSAKAKAVDRLGLSSRIPLPSNTEVELALAERNRIFRSDSHYLHLLMLRQCALNLMRQLETFRPYLVGSVLMGTATEHASIDLHLFSEPHEAVDSFLNSEGRNYKSMQYRQSFRKGAPEYYPGYKIVIDDFEYCVTVFPEVKRKQAPLSPINGKPMERANIKEVERLSGPPQGDLNETSVW